MKLRAQLRGFHRQEQRPGWVRRGLAAAAMVLLLNGCTSDGLVGMPLPGGAPSGDGYAVTVEFADVLDLVPQAAVKVNDVTVGSVEKVWLKGWTAQVRIRVSDTVNLPDNATAAVRQSSLLGEKFVSLAAPDPAKEKPQGQLSDGDRIPLSRTERSVEIEEVFSALALVLSGGGLPQLRTINSEVARALAGRESDVKKTLHELNDFIGALDKQKSDIVRAIDALDRLSSRLAADKTTIANAIDALGPGLEVLADQRENLTTMLTSLRKLGDVGTRVIRESRADTIASLKALQPLLTNLVRAGNDLPNALGMMLSYPFPPNVGGAIIGDYVNLHLTADLDIGTILSNLLKAAPEVPDEPGQPPANPADSPIVPVNPDGRPATPGESNSHSGSLADLLLGGASR